MNDDKYPMTKGDHAQLTDLAKKQGIETLDTRNSDSLDFHDMAVWQIKEMMEAAWQLGRGA